MAYKCSSCGFELFNEVSDLPDHNAALGLYNDARFPGRCLLVLRPHFDSLESIPGKELLDFMNTIPWVGHVLREALGADRINYAILGNAERHVHAHLIPRYYANDPIPTKAPWAHPDPVTPMTVEETARITGLIRIRFNNGPSTR